MMGFAPFVVTTGWIATALGAVILGTGGSPHDAGMAMMLVAAGACLVAAWRNEP